MKVFAFKLILLISICLIQACGPSVDEIREKERQEREAAQQKAREEVLVYEALELIKSQSQAIARGEKIVPARETEPDRPADTQRTITTPAGTYTIQVASLNTRQNATRELNTWKSRGFNDAFISEHGGGYRVRLGRYNTNQDAQNQAIRVNSEYNVSAWVDRIRDTPPGTSSASESGRFTVQVAAVNSQSAANGEINRWKERGFSQAFTQEVRVEGLTLYRIRLGRFETRSQASEALGTVKERYGVDAVIFEM